MSDQENQNVDEGLRGNEQIEEAIAALQQEPSQEMLAHTLTVIRRRMNEISFCPRSDRVPHRAAYQEEVRQSETTYRAGNRK